MKLFSFCTASLLAIHSCALGTRQISDTTSPSAIVQHAEQDIVTWDSQSFFIKGERLMIMSGEFHPFRLPVPSLWLDVLQKVKAMGFNCVSFYVDWALIEGKPGVYKDEGVFDIEPFFLAAQQAGIYLIARPGPYINAEVNLLFSCMERIRIPPCSLRTKTSMSS